MAYQFRWGTNYGALNNLTSELKIEISDEFAKASAKILKNNLEEIINRISELEKELIAISDDKNTRKLQNSEEQLKNLLKESYATIMQIRELLTGQTINYRIFTGNSSSGYVARSITMEELLSQSSGYSAAKDELTILTNRFTKESNMDKDYNTRISDRLAEIKENYMERVHYKNRETGEELTATGWAISLDKIAKRGHKLDKRIQDMLMIKDKNGKLIPRIYTEGHLLEGLAAYEEKEYDKWSIGEYFSDNLRSDNISGFKAGDIGTWQIKKTGARLMRTSTIKTYITEIRRTLESLQKGEKEITKTLQEGSTTESIAQHLKGLFTMDKQTDDLLNNVVQDSIDSVLNEFASATGATVS